MENDDDVFEDFPSDDDELFNENIMEIINDTRDDNLSQVQVSTPSVSIKEEGVHNYPSLFDMIESSSTDEYGSAQTESPINSLNEKQTIDDDKKEPLPSPFLKYKEALQQFFATKVVVSTITNTELYDPYRTICTFLDTCPLTPHIISHEQVHALVKQTCAHGDVAGDVTFIHVLSRIAEQCFDNIAFENIAPTSHHRADLILGILDPHGIHFDVILELHCGISHSEVETVAMAFAEASIKSSAPRQNSFWRSHNNSDVQHLIARVSRKSSFLLGMEGKTTASSPKTQLIREFKSKINAMETHSPSNSSHSAQTENEFVERMQRDITFRRRKSTIEAQNKLRQEEQEAILNTPRRPTNASLRMLQQNGALGEDAREQTFERLYTSRTAFLSNLRENYEEYRMHDPYTGQKLFAPKINPSSKRMFANKSVSPAQTSQSLYANAISRAAKKKALGEAHDEEIKKLGNRPKMTKQSGKYLHDRLTREIFKMFQLLDVSKQGFIGVTHALLMLQHFGLFPDVMLMNLEKGGKERTMIISIWKLLKSRKFHNAAELSSITALICATILHSERKNVMDNIYFSCFNIDGPEDEETLNDIVKELRLNYYSRCPNSKFLGFRLHRDLATVTESDLVLKEKAEAEQRHKTLPPGVEYSIDGIPILQDGEHAKGVLHHKKRLLRLRQRVIGEEMEECTFSPKIIHLPEEKQNMEKIPVFHRLYMLAPHHMHGPSSAPTEFLKEKHELEECTFIPDTVINKKNTKERMEAFRKTTQHVVIPKEFEEKIQQLRMARVALLQQRAREAEPFRPTHLDMEACRSKTTGLIKTAPFNMNTPSRGNKTLVRKHGWEMTRKMSRKSGQDTIAIEDDLNKGTDIVDDEVSPIMHIDVHLSPTWTERLHVWKGDTPEVLVKQFTTQHQIDKSKEGKLLELIRSEMEATEREKNLLSSSASSTTLRELESPEKENSYSSLTRVMHQAMYDL